MIKIAPEDRATIANVIDSLSNMGGVNHIQNWIESAEFKDAWQESRKSIHLINNEWKFFKANLDDEQIDKELDEYITDVKDKKT